MYLIDIVGSEYKLRQKWSEISLNEMAQVYALCKDIPEKLKLIYKALAEEKPADKVELTKEDTIKYFPFFYGKILTILSDIPQEVIDKCDWQSRTVAYNYSKDGISCKSVVFSVLHYPFDHEYQKRKYFINDGEQYYLPESAMINGEERMMANEPAITFTESSDLFLFSEQLFGGRFEVMANIISILCRPENEIYNETISLQRAEKFKLLPMDIVWDIFFLLMPYLVKSKINTQIFFRAEISAAKKHLSKAVSGNGVGMVRY